MTDRHNQPRDLHGARGYVLLALATTIDAGETAISYVELARRTNYSITAVQAAINALERYGYITVTRAGYRHRNMYKLLPLGREAINRLKGA